MFMYIGETSINAYTRGKEHIDLYNTLLSKPPKSDGETASVLFKHKQFCHTAQESPVFTMLVTGRYDTALTRQVTEGIQINNATHHLMNSRREWNHNRMVSSTLQAQ